ncbi:MAG: T9SS type A sorting domain-containing protein [Bacteroidales bacterium]|nr:T9SS type A sorting domain-containing protein [Bacteroidales bacterium]MCF8391244.1 T9SS type A sorting domain-containing protein [Bacteroidales bacterium]
MKKSILFAFVIIAANGFMAYNVLNNNSVHSTGGAAPGYCNDPIGGNKTCTSCHSGPGATFIADLITSDVPVEGYTPNTTYTITATIAREGHSKFGFEISPQTQDNSIFIGTLINTNSETQLTGSGNNYITHTSGGTIGEGSKTWTFDWTAPDQGTGDAIMYGAFNVTNSGNNSGLDTIYTSTLLIPENTSAGAENFSSIEQSFSAYPNPASELITIKIKDNLRGKDLKITDQAGRQVYIGKLDDKLTSLNISNLPSGIYLLQVGEQKELTLKIIKQ